MTDKNLNLIPPDWVPTVEPGSKILIIGASGGIGASVVNMLQKSDGCFIGAHARNANNIPTDKSILPLIQDLKSAQDCEQVIENFVATAGGIDGLVLLAGGISSNDHWTELNSEDWESDISLNLNIPFYLGQYAFNQMKQQSGGGKIIFSGTESALHGGGPNSLAYGVSKKATECLVQGMARDGGPHNILINGIRMGYINSGFHQRWQNKSTKDLEGRMKTVPLGRAGSTDEVAALITYLLSKWGNFITGQMMPITGGDWL